MNRRDAEDTKVRPEEEFDPLTHAVIGAAIEVHRTLGPGFLESVYEASLAVEFELRAIQYERQRLIPLTYKGHSVGEGRLDFLVAEQLVVELKAVEALAPIHKAQLLSYLKLSGKKIGLLINFNVELLKHGITRMAN